MESELVAQLERAEVSEDDLELDSEDMDSEFEEALEEVLEKANATKKLKRLKKASALKPGSAALTALA